MSCDIFKDDTEILIKRLANYGEIADERYSKPKKILNVFGEMVKLEIEGRVEEAILTKADPAKVFEMSLEQALFDVTNEGLGYLYAQLPGTTHWEKFYV